MFKSLFWNIRSINSNGALEILKQMIRSHKFHFIALSEPFYKANTLDKYKIILGYQHAFLTTTIKFGFSGRLILIEMWWKRMNNRCLLLSNIMELHFSWLLFMQNVNIIWEKNCGINLGASLENYNMPWFITGDFNCITDPREKKEGILHRMSKILSFLQCIIDCELVDAGYTSSAFIWCNG